MFKVLVTGANGFLGRHVVEELLKQNYEIRVFVRSKEKFSEFSSYQGIEIIEGDLRFYGAFEKLLSGISAVVHLAASKKGDMEEQFESTVVGTEKLLMAMGNLKIKRLILCSSLSVYDFGKIGKKLSVDTPLETDIYDRDGYAISKIWQERVAKSLSQKYGFDLTIFRPAMMWGDKDEYPLVLSIPFGKCHVVVGPLKPSNLVHVRICAQAMVDSIEDSRCFGKVYNLFDDEKINAWHFMGRFLQSTGKPGVRLAVPYTITYQCIRLMYAILKGILGKGLKVPSLFVPRRFEARFKPFKRG